MNYHPPTQLAAARYWVTREHYVGNQAGARHVLAAIVSREAIDPQGVAWLEAQRDSAIWKDKALWASLILEKYS